MAVGISNSSLSKKQKNNKQTKQTNKQTVVVGSLLTAGKEEGLLQLLVLLNEFLDFLLLILKLLALLLKLPVLVLKSLALLLNDLP